MRITLIIFLILIEHCISDAQEISRKYFRIGITGGYGKYIQSDLKKLNQDVKRQLNFDTRLIEDFPANTFWGAYLLVRLAPGFYIGPSYQFHTTGSRLGLKDYSGSYTFDQILSCNSVGIQIEKSVIKTGKLVCSADAVCGVNISVWETKEDLIVGTQANKTSVRFSALRPFIYPAIKLEYPVTGPLSVSLSGGFSFDLSGKYKADTPGTGKTDLIAKWTGPRASVSIDYSF